MQPRDRQLLEDIIDASKSIAEFIAPLDEQTFIDSDLHQSAVAFKLLIIGEASARLSDELRRQHPAAPWREAIANRSVMAHGYHGMEWRTVWDTATRDVPGLQQQITDIVAAGG